VAAVDVLGDLSAMSADAKVTLPTPPSAPAGLVVTPISATKVGLTWSPAAGGGLPVVGYQVFRGSSPSNLSQVAGATETSHSDDSLNPGSTYYYAVEAEDSGGDLSQMSVVAKVTLPTPPSAPAGLVATPISATKVSLTWSPAASGGLPVVGYQVFRGSSPSNLSQVGSATQTSHTYDSLNPGSTYYYAVAAQDSGGDLSPMSAVAQVALFTLPSPPANLVATPILATRISLTWSPSASGGLQVVGYQVFRGSSPSSLSQVGGTTQTTCTDAPLIPGTTYYYAVQALDTGGDLSAMSGTVPATTPGNPNTPPLNLLTVATNTFSPSGASLPGLPQTIVNGVAFDDVGYQDGILINGHVIYYPHQITQGGSSWMQAVNNGITQGVMISYNASGLLDGFSNSSNWTWFDLTTLDWYSKDIAQPGNHGNLNIAGGYMGGASAGNIVYPTPDYHNGYNVFVAYDSSKPLTSPSAYQTFVPPGYNTTMGHGYGWCTAVYDGRFVYYAPLANPVYGDSGNIFRYDTTQPFSNLNTGGPTSAWANFDMSVYNAGAQGFQEVVYDGHRYTYYIPFHLTTIVRYDTWNGGAGPDPSGFTSWTNYTALDPTLLNTAGYPLVAGQGSTANLAGFTGAHIAWDAAHENEWLYFVPWATFPNDAQNPTFQSTALRVRVGTHTGSAWSPVDFTSTATSPVWSTPDWEMYDLSLLTENPAWQPDWPYIYPTTSPFAGQSMIAGWQLAWLATNNSSGVTFPPRVGFVPDTSAFIVEHDVGHHLYDPSGWYVAEVPDAGTGQPYSIGTMGGGYDAANAILYPSSPNPPLYAFQFQ